MVETGPEEIPRVWATVLHFLSRDLNHNFRKSKSLLISPRSYFGEQLEVLQFGNDYVPGTPWENGYLQFLLGKAVNSVTLMKNGQAAWTDFHSDGVLLWRHRCVERKEEETCKISQICQASTGRQQRKLTLVCLSRSDLVSYVFRRHKSLAFGRMTQSSEVPHLESSKPPTLE